MLIPLNFNSLVELCF